MPYRVAIVSTDGKFINQHFGHANNFHIFDLTEDSYTFLESRENISYYHEKRQGTEFDQGVEPLSDCKAIFVAQIGPGAAAHMIKKGIRVFETPYKIEDVLQKVITSISVGEENEDNQ